MLLDLLDGALARARGGGSVFGAVLDSAGDRVADAAIFGSLIWWFSGAGDNRLLVLLALLCLVLGVLTSYIKARAEGVGLPCDVGIVERLERLLLALFGTGLAGLGVPYALHVAPVGAARRQRGHRRPAAARRPPGGPPAAAAGAADPPCPARCAPGSTARATDAGFAAGWRAVRMLPEPAARGAFDRAGRWAAGREGKGARQLRANLRVATGGRLPSPSSTRPHRPRPALLRPLLAGGLPAADAKQRADRRRHRGRRPRAPAEGARQRPRPGHGAAAQRELGRRRASGSSTTSRGPFMTVAERLKPESLYRRFLDYRESLGFRVVPLTGGPRPSTEVLRDWLSDGGRHLPAGRPEPRRAAAYRSTSSAGRRRCPAARRCSRAQTGAALVPTVCQFTERGWRLVFSPEIPVDGPGRLKDRVAGAMQSVADAFADVDRRAAGGLAHARPIWADVPPAGVGRRPAGTRR